MASVMVEAAPDTVGGPPPGIHVLWMTTGLGCEGESVALTSATNPSLEDLLHGVIPNSPRIEREPAWRQPGTAPQRPHRGRE